MAKPSFFSFLAYFALSRNLSPVRFFTFAFLTAVGVLPASVGYLTGFGGDLPSFFIFATTGLF